MADYLVSRVQVQVQAAVGSGHAHAASNYDYDAASASASASASARHQQAHSLADHRPPPVSQRTRGPRSLLAQQQQQQHLGEGDGHGRRQALEQEVAELRQQLSNEQTVHHILARALQPSSSASASSSVVLGTIPAFIPTKAKELLAELVLVEEEIARLETQIQNMKEKEARRLMQQKEQSNNGGANNPPPSPPPAAAAPAPAEIKSMFFISQAMDGEYLSKVKSPRDRRPPAAGMTSPRNSTNVFAATGLPPRHSLDNKHQQQQPTDAGTGRHTPTNTSTSTSTSTKKNMPSTHLHHELPITTTTTNTKKIPIPIPHQQPPNKLSERIVKCLVCIFIRLLRSSRVAELQVDKSSSANLQGMGSFRMDTALSVAASKDKERGGQQDHYAIFAIPDAIVRDIGPYKNLVRFTSSSLDLRGFSTSPLLTKLREMLEALQQVDLRALNHHQKLAFWLNVYNTCIMHGILQNGLPSNQDKLLALKNKATINVSGHKFNALVIENFILRQPSSVKEEFWRCDVEVEEQAVREVYGLKSSEPNIVFALCCGIRSSPALRIYKADRVAMELEKAKLEYLQASLVVTTSRRLMIPGLLHWSMHDFAKDMESLVRWICEQLPTSWSLRKSMVDCLSLSLRGQQRPHNSKVEEVVDVIPFDYEFQYLLPMM